MKAFVILSVLVSMAMARPGLVQVGPEPTLQSRVSASASTTSSSPVQLPLLRLLPNGDGRDLDSIELASAEQEDNARSILGLSPLLSTSSSASAFSLPSTIVTADGRVINPLDANLADALRAQIQSQQQQRLIGVSPLLSATHLARSSASLSPTGASSSSSVQILESPELSAARLQQNVLLAQATGIQSRGLPLLLGTGGQVVASPLLLL